MPEPSARHDELLDKAYAYVLEHGLSGMSLRPLAAAIGSSPRVLLYLFGSKDGLLAALLGRARQAELAFLAPADTPDDLATMVRTTWTWLAAQANRRLLILWFEAYTKSLTDPTGPWSTFADSTVADWLTMLGRSGATPASCTLALATLRGALLDLLATGDVERTTAAVHQAWPA